MPRVGFEPMILVFQRTKMVHALDRAATMIGIYIYTHSNFSSKVMSVITSTALYNVLLS
jgi:hypothetical protein